MVKLDPNGNISSLQTASNRGYIERINGIEFEMVNIPAGSFLMGSPRSEAGRWSSESPQHRVNVPEFFMAQTQVTQALWREVAKLPKFFDYLTLKPSQFKYHSHPV